MVALIFVGGALLTSRHSRHHRPLLCVTLWWAIIQLATLRDCEAAPFSHRGHQETKMSIWAKFAREFCAELALPSAVEAPQQERKRDPRFVGGK
jgi:hypothetical protein